MMAGTGTIDEYTLSLRLDALLSRAAADYQTTLNALALTTAGVLAQQRRPAHPLSDDLEQAVRIYGDLVRELTRERIRAHDEGH
jgi:hypothetical protein